MRAYVNEMDIPWRLSEITLYGSFLHIGRFQHAVQHLTEGGCFSISLQTYKMIVVEWRKPPDWHNDWLPWYTDAVIMGSSWIKGSLTPIKTGLVVSEPPHLQMPGFFGASVSQLYTSYPHTVIRNGCCKWIVSCNLTEIYNRPAAERYFGTCL